MVLVWPTDGRMFYIQLLYTTLLLAVAVTVFLYTHGRCASASPAKKHPLVGLGAPDLVFSCEVLAVLHVSYYTFCVFCGAVAVANVAAAIAWFRFVSFRVGVFLLFCSMHGT